MLITGSKRRSFTPEYRANAVSLVVDGHWSIVDVAHGIGVSLQALGKWVKKAKDEQPVTPDLDVDERVELERLRKENADLRMSNEFLKKSGGLVRENQQ